MTGPYHNQLSAESTDRKLNTLPGTELFRYAALARRIHLKRAHCRS